MESAIFYKFKPNQHVVITAYDLNYPGRIQECIWNGHDRIYRIEFAENGKIDTRSFLEDEIEAHEI